MKTTGTRSLIVYIFSIAFAAGLLFFLGEYVLKGGEWAIQPFNKHISGGTALTGQILDRNGQVLSSSSEDGRAYNEDEAVRRATLHTVGDTAGYISTSIQYRYRSELSGYTLLTGLGTPFGNRSGGDITLTLDADLCKTAYQAMNGRKGAVLVCDYTTGEILCMVSTPSFDPANPPEDLFTDETGKYEGVYLNNALSGTYTPGSIFKLVTSAAAIQRIPDLDSRTFFCEGSKIINGNTITCTGVHGSQSFQDALGNSCNIAFGDLAVELGETAMMETAEQLGFGSSWNVDGVLTAKSQYDVRGASEDELAWSGIGQYTDEVNPIHMLRMMCAIASDGTPVELSSVQSVSGAFGFPVSQNSVSWGDPMLDAATANRLKTYMRTNVKEYFGESQFAGLEVCAKTGTGEVGAGKQPNAWVVGFSSRSDLPLAFAVVVEEGGYGRDVAVPVASAVLQQAASRYA